MPVPGGPQPVGLLGDLDPGGRQLADQHVHVVGATVLDHHLPAGQAGGDQEGGHHQPVGDDGVGGRVERVDPLDLDARGARPGDPGPHGVEEVGQVPHLGLAGGVLDDGGPLGQHRGHQHVVGAGVAGVLEHHPVAHQPGHRRHRRVDPALDVAVGRGERGAHRLEGVEVHVDRAGGRSRRRRAGTPWPSRTGPAAVRGPPPRPASSPPARRGPRGRSSAGVVTTSSSGVRPRRTSTPMAPSSSPMMSTSVMRGTLVSTWVPSASRQAAISLSTEFLAPPARTVPSRGPLGVTTNRSTPPVWPGSPGRPVWCPSAATGLDRGTPGPRPQGQADRRMPVPADRRIAAPPPATIVIPRDRRTAGTRSQPGHGTRPGHRGRRPGRLPVDGPGGQRGCRRRRGQRHAHRPVQRGHGRRGGDRRRARRTTPPCSTTASASGTAPRPRPTSPSTPSTAPRPPPSAGAAPWR